MDKLEELREYGIHLKAEIVYRRCLRNRKFKIAERIRIKYKLRDGHDDSIIAFGLALMTLSNCNKHKP